MFFFFLQKDKFYIRFDRELRIYITRITNLGLLNMTILPKQYFKLLIKVEFKLNKNSVNIFKKIKVIYHITQN
jgi:hypothetical protein